MMSTMTLPATPEDDLALRVRAAARGDAAAQTYLYRRFLPWVHGLLIARFRPAVADELTQECFATAFQRLHQLREPAHFGAWIGAIARHQRHAGEDEHAIEAAELVRDATSNPEHHAEAMHMLAAIRALPAAYRDTLALRLVEGLSGPEIAALTGLDPGSVRVNLHRGMGKLRAALGLTSEESDDA